MKITSNTKKSKKGFLSYITYTAEYKHTSHKQMYEFNTKLKIQKNRN